MRPRTDQPARAAAVAALFITLSIASSANAQPTVLPPVVVTPSRLAQSHADVLPATTVITREELARWQPADLVGLLSRQAGIEMARAGGPGGAASLFIRGANSNQLLVLVDGVRLNAAVSGAPSLGGIAVDSIERIEIVRGNLSSVYGSAAIGGVVQIFTRGAREDGVSMTAEIGEGRSAAGSAAASASTRGVKLGGSAAVRQSRQFSAIDAGRIVPGPFSAGANADLDGNRNANGSFALRWQAATETQLALRGWISENRSDFDSTIDGPAATHVERSRLWTSQADLDHKVSAQWTTRLQIGAMRDHSRNRSSAAFSFDNGEFVSENRQVVWSNAFRFDDGVNAQLGIEQLRQRGASTSFDPAFANALTGFARDVTSPWAGINVAQGSHHLQFNARHDRYSDVGSATTGLMAYGFQLTPAWRARVQWSNAFRAPSFSDLYFPFFGNPQLQPERARSAEAGVSYGAGAVSARLSFFRTDTRDLIVFDPASMQAENVSRARSTGAEFETSTRIGQWSLGFNGTLLRAVDKTTGLRLLRRAPRTVGGRVDFEADRWSAGGEVLYVAARDDLDVNTFARTELRAYTVARLVASWRFNAAMSMTMRIENLFDERYETISGYNVQPRTAFIGVQWRQ